MRCGVHSRSQASAPTGSDLPAIVDGGPDLGDRLGDGHPVALGAVPEPEADTAPASMSSSPAISMNGIFCFWALRIFFCIRSSEASTSTRIAVRAQLAATSCR